MPTCTITITNTEPVFSGDLVTFEISGVDDAWMDFASLSFGDGNSEQNLDINQLTYTHTYTSGAVFTATLIVENVVNPQDPGVTVTGSCSVGVEVNHCIDLGITGTNNQWLTTCDCEELEHGCIWLEEVCPVDFGTFGWSSDDQYKEVEFGSGALDQCHIVLHDYYDNGSGVSVHISASDMIGSVNNLAQWITAADLSVRVAP